jgi:RNA-binding protein
MLTGKQKRYLRSLANQMEAVIQVGKGGVTDTVVSALDQALTARELVKVRVLNNCHDPAAQVGKELAEQAGAELVQQLGQKLTFFRVNPENPIHQLPGE